MTIRQALAKIVTFRQALARIEFGQALLRSLCDAKDIIQYQKSGYFFVFVYWECEIEAFVIEK